MWLTRHLPDSLFPLLHRAFCTPVLGTWSLARSPVTCTLPCAVPASVLSRLDRQRRRHLAKYHVAQCPSGGRLVFLFYSSPLPRLPEHFFADRRHAPCPAGRFVSSQPHASSHGTPRARWLETPPLPTATSRAPVCLSPGCWTRGFRSPSVLRGRLPRVSALLGSLALPRHDRPGFVRASGVERGPCHTRTAKRLPPRAQPTAAVARVMPASFQP